MFWSRVEIIHKFKGLNLYCIVFQISLDAIKSGVPEVSLQGIEFWSTVCDEEIDLDLEAEEVWRSKLYSELNNLYWIASSVLNSSNSFNYHLI